MKTIVNILWLYLLPMFITLGQTVDVHNVQDSICFGYRFRPGDSLVYEVRGQDSIVIAGEKPIRQWWKTEMTIVCDSITASGHYAIRQWYSNSYRERWYHEDPESVVRDHHSPVDSLFFAFRVSQDGWVVEFTYSDTTTPWVAFGSIFQPRFWRSGLDGCWMSNRSWTAQRLREYLPENSYPPSVREFSTVFTARYRKDSLSIPIAKCTFASVAKQEFLLPVGEHGMLIQASVNEYGFVIQDSQWFVPRHLYATAQAQFTMMTKAGEKVNGNHFTRVEYFLRSAQFGSVCKE